MHTEETRIYLALLAGAVIFTVLMVFFIVTIIRYQRKKAALYHERMQGEMGLLEKERARIAKDLHDEIGVTISAISFFLEGIESRKKTDVLLVQKIKNHIEGMMGKVRRLSYNIMPKILEVNGLGDAVADLLDILSYSNRIKITCLCTIQRGIVDKDREIQIYRIVEEIVNNTLKHAKAANIFCELKQVVGKIQLHIKDDGIGFNKKDLIKSHQGSGLQNILARVNILNGSIYLNADETKGVEYFIEIPI